MVRNFLIGLVNFWRERDRESVEKKESRFRTNVLKIYSVEHAMLKIIVLSFNLRQLFAE